MFKWLKKQKRKKEVKKMNGNHTELTNYENDNDNYEENNDTVDQIFRDFDESYSALKKNITKEIIDYEQMYKYQQNQADIYRNKVQVRDVMNEILPIISDMRNDIIDSEDIDELKKVIQVRYKQLFTAFARSGIKIKMHERNQTIELEERINGSAKPTTDPMLHQKVACSNKMGCVIKGEEDNPILEEVEIYIFNKSKMSDQPYNTDEQVNDKEVQVYSSGSKESDIRINEESRLQNEDSKTNTDQKCTKFDAVICNQDKYVRFNAPVKLIKQSSAPFSVISQEDSIEVDTWKKVDIPTVYIDHENCSIYFGSQLLSMEFSLQNVELYYRVSHNKDNNCLLLEFINKATEKVFVKHQLTFTAI